MKKIEKTWLHDSQDICTYDEDIERLDEYKTHVGRDEISKTYYRHRIENEIKFEENIEQSEGIEEREARDGEGKTFEDSIKERLKDERQEKGNEVFSSEIDNGRCRWGR